MLTPKEHAEIESMIDALWLMYDDAQSAGNKEEASSLANRAFSLAEKLPQNCVYLKVH